jgi:hypothetical protein
VTALRLAHIVRHPIKSLGYQEIERAALTRGRPLAFDRVWALATTAAGFGDDAVDWAPKMRFVRGAAQGSLQAVQIRLNDADDSLTLTHPLRPDFTGTLPQDAAALVDWVRPLWPATRPAPDRLVTRADGLAFGDMPDPYLSVLSLTTNRILGQRMRRDLSIHRWRGNLWLDGLAPWEEFDLVGRDLRIGSARLRVEERITRCVATTFDPQTGQQAGDTLAALEQAWGHTDFGVYARVIESGDIFLSDTVTILT